MRVINRPSNCRRRLKNYRDLLPIVYKRLAEEWGLAVSWDECVAYGRTVGELAALQEILPELFSI